MPLPFPLVDRGVYRAPCYGPEGQIILYAVDHNHRLLPNGWAWVAPGDNPFTAGKALRDRLDEEDPQPIARPRSA